MLEFLSAPNLLETKNFHFIDWVQLIHCVEKPQNLGELALQQAKTKSPIIAATDAPNKQKETILSHDNFTLLRLDLDKTPYDIESITDALQTMGLESFIIHTTISHQQGNNGNRYRVYIELAESITYQIWARLETYLSYVFGADDCASRPQQIMYLPVRLNGDKYAYYINQGKALTAEQSQLYKDATAFEQGQIQKQEQAKTVPLKPQLNENLVGTQKSIIDLFNQSYDWPSLLHYFGYKQQGKAYLPPESTSKQAGAYILTSPTDGRERYYSHHESDPCATGKAIDQFDFVCIREFNGNEREALKQIAARYFPLVDKHNKKEWAINQHNQQAQKLFREVK